MLQTYFRLVSIKVILYVVQIHSSNSGLIRQIIGMTNLPLNICGVRRYQSLQISLNGSANIHFDTGAPVSARSLPPIPEQFVRQLQSRDPAEEVRLRLSHRWNLEWEMHQSPW